MYLALNMPTWLDNIVFLYGDMIAPALVAVAVAILTWVAITIKSNAKVNAVKADLQIQALKEVANREDNKPQLEEQSKKLETLERIVALQSEMFNLAFQNSNLTPEIKDNLTSLNNKIKFGPEEDLVKELETRNASLEAQVESLQLQLNTTPIETVVQEETKKRTRR